VRRAAVEELARGWKDDPEILEILRDRFANDPDEKVRKFAEEQLEKLDKLK